MADRIQVVGNYIVANGVKIARMVPEERALEFLEQRTGHNREGGSRRRAVVSLDDLASLGDCTDKMVY